ncbi:MAG: anaerobic ribonucleoside-triphosphate reductase activating protein [Candidatus Njordarchaeales archaeon]
MTCLENITASIAGWKDLSLVDVLGYPSFTVWFNFCNFNCPWCQNWHVVSGSERKDLTIKEILDIIADAAYLVEYLHVTGGEPTLQPKALEALYACVKRKNLLKNSLNTNGSRPEIIKDLITKKLIDHIAMDIKAPLSVPERYGKVIGLENAYEYVERVERSTRIALEKLAFVELRTTFVPGLLMVDDLIEIGRELRELGCADGCYYVIQQFNPSETIRDERYKRLRRIPEEAMVRIAKRVKSESGLKNVYVRTIESGVLEIK